MIKPNRTVQVCRTTIHQPRRPPTSPRIRGITDYGFRTDVAYLNNSTFRARRFRYSLLSDRGVWCGGNVDWHFPVCRYDQGLRHVTTLPSAEWLVVHGIHVGVGLFVG